MQKTKPAARKPKAPAKRAVHVRSKAPPKAPKRRQVGASERVSGVSAPKHDVDRRYFGTPPKPATHILLTKHSANGSAERCFVNRDGVAQEKLPIVYASVEKLRKLWGPGTYRGQWLGLEHGKWKALGRTAEVRILAQMPDDSAARPASRAIGDVVASDDVAEPARSTALVRREPDDVVDLRVKAEREIARMRLDAEREVGELRFNVRLEELRSENTRALRQLEERIDARSGSDDDDDEPSPWDWIMPLLEKLRPTLEELVPRLLANVAAKGA